MCQHVKVKTFPKRARSKGQHDIWLRQKTEVLLRLRTLQWIEGQAIPKAMKIHENAAIALVRPTQLPACEHPTQVMVLIAARFEKTHNARGSKCGKISPRMTASFQKPQRNHLNIRPYEKFACNCSLQDL